MLPDTEYWALARTEGGWRLEFAAAALESSAEDLACRLFGIEDRPSAEVLAYHDRTQGQARIAYFAGTRLIGALYLSREPVAVSRSWACAQLAADHSDLGARSRVIAGRAGADMPDKGAIVCSCFSVGVNEIGEAARAGCVTVEAVGRAVKAGTNCGSCRAEIRTLLAGMVLPAAAE